jgi:hypothetical protein
MPTFRAAVAACAIASLAGCASRAFVRPTDVGAPAPDAAAVWMTTSASCRGLTGVQAALGLTGRIREQRIPGLAGATLYLAASSTGDIGLEARVAAQLLFRLGGTAERATLYLPSDNRVVTGRAADIVDALVGISLAPERLLAVLGGCVTRADRVDRAVRHGSILEVVTPDATVFLAERDGAWAVRAGQADEMTIDYRRNGTALRDIALQSPPGGRDGVSISLRVKQIDLAPTLAPALFTVVVPDGAAPMTVDELRTSGLVDRGDQSR